MSKVTTTIHRALTLVSKAESQIAEKISSGLYVSTTVGSIGTPTDRSYKNKEELRRRIQSDTDAVESNLKLISALKVAIAIKNLETLVDFKGRQVSITELLAIRSTLQLRTRYAAELGTQIRLSNNIAEKANQEISAQVSNSNDENKALVEQQLQVSKGVNIITANDESAAEKLRKLREENDFLTNEIDAILSEVNIATTIEYEL